MFLGFSFSEAAWWHFVFESSEMGEIAEKFAFLRGKNAITHQPLKGLSFLGVPLGGVGVNHLGFLLQTVAAKVLKNPCK